MSASLGSSNPDESVTSVTILHDEPLPRSNADSPFLSTNFVPAALLLPQKNTLLKSHGRPPWYDQQGRRISDAFVIGITGGSASGKTYVAQEILRSMGSIPSVVILSQDSFYKPLSEEELQKAFANMLDLDHPDAIDMPLFTSCLRELKEGKQTHVPVYSFKEHQRLPETKYLYGAAIVIVEGIMALQEPALRDLYDLKIFVQCDSDLMLARRIRRDVAERGRDIQGILDQYLRYVKPAYDAFVLPTARYADMIVPGYSNAVAIDLISTHVKRMLTERSCRLRAVMGSTPRPLPLDLSLKAGSNLVVLEQKPQLKGIYTVLRDRKTSREDFIFYTDRLATLLIECAMCHLPFHQRVVSTHLNEDFVGKEMDATSLCGITVLRAGGPLERGLRRVLRDVLVGSLLIQPDPKTGEPLLLHSMLPQCIRSRESAKTAWVLVLDAQMGTGASALMSIRVLLDHGVREDRIIFVTFLVAKDKGAAAIENAFPKIRIVTGAVDEGLDESWILNSEGESEEKVRTWIIRPGMGLVGDRYYT